MCICVRHAGCCDLRHHKFLKHPHNPYSIERASHKLSKTPSHALIDAVGGPDHHFEYTTRALSAPIPARRAKARPQGLIRGRGSFASQIADLLPPDEAWVGGAVPPGPAWTGKRAPSAFKVMVWATYCINQGVQRRFGKLMSCPFDRVWVLRVFEQL